MASPNSPETIKDSSDFSLKTLQNSSEGESQDCPTTHAKPPKKSYLLSILRKPGKSRKNKCKSEENVDRIDEKDEETSLYSSSTIKDLSESDLDTASTLTSPPGREAERKISAPAMLNVMSNRKKNPPPPLDIPPLPPPMAPKLPPRCPNRSVSLSKSSSGSLTTIRRRQNLNGKLFIFFLFYSRYIGSRVGLSKKKGRKM